MLQLLLVLLVIWVALVVIGTLIEGLFWLVVVGAVLFLATAGYGWVKREALRR